MMFWNPFDNAALFLVHTLFSLYTLVVMLRLIMQAMHINYYNPVTQFVIRLTDPPVRPLRRTFPGFRGIDLAIVALLLILTTIKLLLIILLQGAGFPSIFGFALWTITDLIQVALNLYFYAILLMVVLSWIAPAQQNPVLNLLYTITAPVLMPLRRLIPPIAGLDLSPLFALIGLQVLSILVVSPLITIAARL